ncbi:hypothetical protein PV371_26365 [Streptomyces sp. TX20-6-3]|uniref:hypothetical protein n=1 Tax=Streptomyces sp. TX20-6-3 TaxID=3028705 RepID=UPI00299FE669|nr:hypothetical protein [Streptomyces sp. TX20-6-3]MDX2563160.1 hypothetical protein [Streptomyces sp. TX20-6-3]
MTTRSDLPVPREVKRLDTAALLALEERALRLVLNQRLDPVWVEAHAASDGTHYLWPALWNSLPHRPEVPPQLRCELLLALRGGQHVMSLLDMLPEDFASLPRVTSRDEGMRVSRLLDESPTVRRWLSGAESASADSAPGQVQAQGPA